MLVVAWVVVAVAQEAPVAVRAGDRVVWDYPTNELARIRRFTIEARDAAGVRVAKVATREQSIELAKVLKDQTNGWYLLTVRAENAEGAASEAGKPAVQVLWLNGEARAVMSLEAR